MPNVANLINSNAKKKKKKKKQQQLMIKQCSETPKCNFIDKATSPLEGKDVNMNV